MFHFCSSNSCKKLRQVFYLTHCLKTVFYRRQHFLFTYSWGFLIWVNARFSSCCEVTEHLNGVSDTALVWINPVFTWERNRARRHGVRRLQLIFNVHIIAAQLFLKSLVLWMSGFVSMCNILFELSYSQMNKGYCKICIISSKWHNEIMCDNKM